MRAWAASILLLAGVDAASAFSDCDGALVKATYKETSKSSKDWRLAKFLKKEEYDVLRHGASADFQIYGVPVGASYEDYKSNVSKLEQKHNESLTDDQVKDILIEEWNRNVVDVYKICIDGHMAANEGFYAVPVGTSGANKVLVLLRWNVPAILPGELSFVGLPSSLSPPQVSMPVGGSVTVELPRSAESYEVSVNAVGAGRSTNPVKIIPKPPKLRRTSRTVYFIACLANDGHNNSGCDDDVLTDAYSNASPEVKAAVTNRSNVIPISGDIRVDYDFLPITEGESIGVLNPTCSADTGNAANKDKMSFALRSVDDDGHLIVDVNANNLGTINSDDDRRKWSIVWRCEATFKLKP